MPDVRLLKPADVVAIGAGKRTFLVTEQLAFDQFAGDRRAIDGQHRTFDPLAGMMDRPRNQFLSGTDFASNQYGAIGLADPFDF